MDAYHFLSTVGGIAKTLFVLFLAMRQFCLPYFFFASIAGSQRAHASGALASFGSIRRRKKKNAERIAASQEIKQIKLREIQLVLTTHEHLASNVMGTLDDVPLKNEKYIIIESPEFKFRHKLEVN